MCSSLIAIIEDDEMVRSSLVDLMHSAGYRAEPFGSAEAFLSALDRSRFGCLIADVHTSGATGFDLVRRLREQSITTPVILITALTEKRLDDKAAAVGALCLLRKPVDTDVLLEIIRESLSGDRHRDSRG